MHDPEEGLTPDGMIRTGARPRDHATAHRLVLDAVRVAIPRDASLYLYGSVATGTAQIPASDIDLLTIGLDGDEAAAIGRALTLQARDTCREVAIAAADVDTLHRDDDEGYGLRVFLRHYCVHLAGPQHHEDLAPAYPGDRRAARGCNGDIAEHAARWRRDLQDDADPRGLGTRIARRTLLAAAGLTSIRTATWTTDRHHAATAWAPRDPGVAALLDWLTQPPSDPEEVRAALDGPVERVVQQFADEIGLWRS